MSNNISQNDKEQVKEEQNDGQLVAEGHKRVSRRFKISTVLAVTAIVVIIGGSAYGLANGTIFQHKGEIVEECGGGSCSDCEDGSSAALLGSAPAQAEGAAEEINTFEQTIVESKTDSEPVAAASCPDCEE
ncbi:MAG: hypothetical protein QME41_06255 [Actinomycetota bacterium]|nr:hypothetical protein [Actinomycetota bacterium]